MLDNGEYSNWVKTIFLGIKADALFRAFRSINCVTRWITAQFLLNNRVIAMKQAQHWNYTAERVERRLKSTPDHLDLWTKVMEKELGDQRVYSWRAREQRVAVHDRRHRGKFLAVIIFRARTQFRY